MGKYYDLFSGTFGRLITLNNQGELWMLTKSANGVLTVSKDTPHDVIEDSHNFSVSNTYEF